jgi:hypothetical protein
MSRNENEIALPPGSRDRTRWSLLSISTGSTEGLL